MQITQVTIFKLIFFSVCVIMITIFVTKMMAFDSGNDNMCQMLMTKSDVTDSVVTSDCPEGFYQNYGKFSDVSGEKKCCVKYNK